MNRKILLRPRPPAEMLSMDGLIAPDTFVAAPDVSDWIRAAYIADDGVLFSKDHAHLGSATIGVLWTTCENVRRGRRVVGQAEMPSRSTGALGVWHRARVEQQLREWFDGVPDFLLTFDAVHSNDLDDRAFCCIAEHELRHCGQELDEFGAPKFDKLTGKPKFTLRAHQVEAFVADVGRYGPEALGDDAVDFMIAAAGQHLSDLQIARACRGGEVPKLVGVA